MAVRTLSGELDGSRPFRQAALWMLFLGPFFFLVYGFCNWFTTQRPDVGVVVFDWERDLPFLPWLILPYMSIDAFFAASVFLCRSREELNRHAYRIVAAIVISAAGFLAFPLRFSFEIPPAGGFEGMLFTVLHGFDQPYNQAPSLHISLLMILWVKYAEHLAMPWRGFMHVWFALVGVSVLGVYQHHVIDAATGFWVGIVCLYLFPDGGWARRGFQADRHSRRIGAYYAGGAALFLALGFRLGGWGWLWLWPAAALSVVALAYFRLGPAVFQKSSGGGVAWWTRVLLFPYRLGAGISVWLQSRPRPAFSEVAPRLSIGGLSAPDARSWDSVLDLAAEFPRPGKPRGAYLSLPVLDLTVPPPETIRAAVAFLERKNAGEALCVHCALGLSRSATIAAAWLVHSGVAGNAHEAFQRLREVRPGIVWSEAHERAVNAFQA